MLSILSTKALPAFLDDFSPPICVPGAQSCKNNVIPQSDLPPWILTLSISQEFLFTILSITQRAQLLEKNLTAASILSRVN